MRWPWNKRPEKKASDSLVQYRGGVYYLGTSTANTNRLKNYVQGYKLCDTVYSCINIITQAALTVPWYVYREVPDGEGGWEVEEVEKHAFNDFMDHPNPRTDWNAFLTRCIGYYLMTGNTYIRMNVGSGGTYGEAEVLPSQQITIKVNADRKTLTYEWRPATGGQMFPFTEDEIIHVKTFNPEDPIVGLSPIEAIARQVDISTFGQEWTISLLENEARPSGILMLQQKISPEQRKELNQAIKDAFSGYENAGKPMVLEAGMDWKAMSITPKELEFLNSEKVNTRKICAAFKVPPELLGDNENKTYSNIKEARKALYQEGAIPILNVFKSAFNRELFPKFDKSGSHFLDFDTSGIEALSEDLDLLWKRVLDAKNSGAISLYEAREEMGYGAFDAPDVLTEPVSMVSTPVDELGQEPEPEEVPEEEEVPPEDEDEKKPKKSERILIKGAGFWQKEERKEAKWTAFHRRIQARQRPIEEIVRKYLTQQTARIAKNVGQAGSLSQVNKWLILDKEKEAGLYVDASIRWYIDSFTKAVRAGLAASKGEISDGEEKALWSFKPGYEERLKAMAARTGWKMTDWTIDGALNLLEQAESESWTVEELTKAIKEKFAFQETWRARRIAATEAARVENYGELEGYKETEFVELKGWLCAFVELSREDHMAADRRYSDEPIPLDEPFEVGGEKMMEPLDDSLGATAGQIVNCKCTMFPQVKEI